MKKFLCKLALLIACIAFALLVLNARYVKTYYWKWENNTHKFETVPYNITLANLGSSHGQYGIRYDDFPQLQGFNFGLEAQCYFYDHALLKQYISHFAPGAVIIIPISYFQITKIMDTNIIRPRYYRFMQKEYMDSWTFFDAFRYAKFPILSAGKSIFHIFVDTADIDPLTEKLAIHTTKEAAQADATILYEQYTAPTPAQKEHNYHENLKEVLSIIDFCLDHALQPVLITIPLTADFNELYARIEGFTESFYRFSSELCQNYTPPYPI